jgi:uncharacterized protein (DUF486 family)
MQEAITMLVFAGFSVLYLKETLTFSQLTGFAMIAGGVAMVFYGRP